MTVAELKRRIQPGVKLRSVYTGSGPFGPDHPFYTEVATVRRVMSTQFTLNRPFKGPDSESHCDFPKATQLTETPTGFRITRAPNMVLEYIWVDQEPRNTLTELMRDFAGWIYKYIQDEYEYRMSDEAVDESIIANEYDFREDGERSDG